MKITQCDDDWNLRLLSDNINTPFDEPGRYPVVIGNENNVSPPAAAKHAFQSEGDRRLFPASLPAAFCR